MGTPKALLQYQGETFLQRLVRVFAQFCDPVVVVTGHHALEVPAPAIPVNNPDPARGQLSSLQAGAANVPLVDAVFFTPVDCPAVQSDTIDALQRAFAGDRLFVVPRLDGSHGHPVLMSSRLIPELLALPISAEARDLVHKYVAQTRYVDVDDAGVLKDVDDPEAYASLTGERV